MKSLKPPSKLPTHEQLCEVLEYDPESGDLTWKPRDVSLFKGKTENKSRALQKTFNKKCAGKKAGSLRKDGYIVVRVHGLLMTAHRILWCMTYKTWPNIIDHNNGIRNDNRLVNLSSGDHQSNLRNQALGGNNTSGQKGVHFSNREKRWVAIITINTKQLYIGSFRDKKDAIAVRKKAEKKYGFHENHGRQLISK